MQKLINFSLSIGKKLFGIFKEKCKIIISSISSRSFLSVTVSLRPYSKSPRPKVRDNEIINQLLYSITNVPF